MCHVVTCLQGENSEILLGESWTESGGAWARGGGGEEEEEEEEFHNLNC
jgi:hypothetical protein